MSNRQMPQAVEAEAALLGSMLLYPDAIETAVEQGLTPEEFYSVTNRNIYQAIQSLYEENKPVLMETLKTRLSDLNLSNAMEGEDYLIQLVDMAGSSSNAKHYVELIQDKARIRRLIDTVELIKSDSFDAQYEMDDVMDRAEKSLLKVTRSRRSTAFVSAKEVVDETVELIQKMSANRTPVTGMKTDFKQLDRVTNGFQKGDLIILAARPSMGKTAFALNLAMNMAEQNNLPVAIFSLEMDSSALIKRMLSSKSGLDGNKLRSGFGITSNDMNSLLEAKEELRNLPLYFNDNSDAVTVGAVASSCRRLQSEKGLGAIVIDYIQLMSSGNSRGSDSRQQEVSDISRALKGIARELQVPVIALSQLSRSVESRSSNKRPMLSDLRESGALEQDADMVLFLYRDSYYEYTKEKDSSQEEKYERSEDSDGIEEMEVIIAKHRNGATGTIKLAYNRSINAFYDYDGYQSEE